MFASTAWPLALLYALLIAFASLFPFTGWSWRGLALADVALAPVPPQYWTWFDVLGNAAGYAPLGFLLTLAALRTWAGAATPAAAMATAAAAALSLAMEALQMFLPQRVPSNLDWLLNAGGAAIGALAAAALHWLGVVARWGAFRARWLPAGRSGGVVLVLLWPWALLFPPAVPFGLGQILWRIDDALVGLLGAARVRAWLPPIEAEGALALPNAMLPSAMLALCVAAGVLAPVLLAAVVVERRPTRAVLAVLLAGAGVGATALSCALSFGPAHAWIWLDAPTQLGLALGLTVAVLAQWMPARWCALALLLALSAQLHWLNLAPANAYFAQTLQMWEQGRFIRFYGLGQWLGWAWPYAALIYAGWRLVQSGRGHPSALAAIHG